MSSAVVSLDETPVLAVVPARGGSKGIPRKNLERIDGRSLIAWAAATVRALPWLDAAVLSTDDEAMAAEGRAHGLDVPFMRPAALAGDAAAAAPMWQHAWRESEAHYGRRFEVSVLLQPTTPLRRAADVERTVRTLLDGGHRAAATVTRVPAHYAPEKIMTVDARGVLAFHRADGAGHTARQTVPAYYHRNGVCYAVRRDTLLDDGHIVEDDCAAVIVEPPVFNIDEPWELELARRWAAGRGGDEA